MDLPAPRSLAPPPPTSASRGARLPLLPAAGVLPSAALRRAWTGAAAAGAGGGEDDPAPFLRAYEGRHFHLLYHGGGIGGGAASAGCSAVLLQWGARARRLAELAVLGAVARGEPALFVCQSPAAVAAAWRGAGARFAAAGVAAARLERVKGNWPPAQVNPPGRAAAMSRCG